MIYLRQDITSYNSNVLEDFSDWGVDTAYQTEESPGLIIPAGEFQIGATYEITVPGTTDYTLIGASDSLVGTWFEATGIGSGTGTATKRSGLTDLSVVRVGSFYYRTIMDDNIGYPPESHLGTRWVKHSVSNTQAMFDLRSTTKSTTSNVADFTTTENLQSVTVRKDEVVLILEPVANGLTNEYYQAKADRVLADLNAEDFTNESNWLLLPSNIVIEFTRGLKDTLAIGYYSAFQVRIDNLGPELTDYASIGSVGDFVYDVNANYREVLTVSSTTLGPPLNEEPEGVLVTAGNFVIDTEYKIQSAAASPTYTTTGASASESVLLGDIVLYAVASSSSGDGVIGVYYKALAGATGSQDLNETDFTNATNWEIQDYTDFTLIGASDNFVGTKFVATGSGSGVGTATEVIPIIAVQDFGGNFREILYTQLETHDNHEDVLDYYSYMYSEYSINIDRSKKYDILPSGSNIRLTLFNEVAQDAECGFLVSDEAVDMGHTLYGIDFSFNSYSTKDVDEFGIMTITKRGIQELLDFETSISSNSLPTMKRKIKNVHDEIVTFILDPSEDSVYENIITLGTVENVSTVLSNPVATTIAWSIHETI